MDKREPSPVHTSLREPDLVERKDESNNGSCDAAEKASAGEAIPTKVG